jgi:hypothetical protein
MGRFEHDGPRELGHGMAMLYTAKPGVDHDKFRERIMCNMMHGSSTRGVTVIITTDMPLQDVASVWLFVLRLLY